jgi:hypothetical protein
MRTRWTVLVVFFALLGFGQQVASALPTLPITSGLIYQLDATDAANLLYDSGTGAIVSWTSTQGSAVGFSMVPGTGGGLTPPTYEATGGGNNNLPNVKFVASSGAAQRLVQNAGGSTTPMCVFIMENTDSPPGNGLGGIWGREGRDNGIRFWSDNPPEGAWGSPGNTHQLVSYAITGTDPNRPDYGLNYLGDNGQPLGSENYYWSDTTVSDAHQTWHYKNWGTIGAYTYNSRTHTWPTTALGNYYEPPARSWSGQIGEVVAYDRYLDDTERQAVEAYLTAKWLQQQAHPGDANRDGVVDLQDFGLLKDNFGMTQGATWAQGDFNADGAIDLQDFGILKDHFGHTTGSNPVTAVPEPATLTFLALGAAVAVGRKRR